MNSAAAGNRATSVRVLPAVAHQGPSLERVPNDQSRTIELPDDIATRIRAGDERALELVFRACYASLCEFAVRYVREDALAEEIVQDLFADLRRDVASGSRAAPCARTCSVPYAIAR